MVVSARQPASSAPMMMVDPNPEYITCSCCERRFNDLMMNRLEKKVDLEITGKIRLAKEVFKITVGGSRADLSVFLCFFLNPALLLKTCVFS
jgi:hypothetical protein